jgi:hypothetical protein
MERVREMTTRLPMAKCRKVLALLWFGAGGVLFSIFVLQTTLGKYGDQASEAWGWLLPAILPTLSLILGILVADAQAGHSQTLRADRFLFILSVILSAGYLLAVSAPIFLQPFVSLSPVDLMKQSTLWLSPFQGLVSGAIGAFFVRRQL